MAKRRTTCVAIRFVPNSVYRCSLYGHTRNSSRTLSRSFGVPHRSAKGYIAEIIALPPNCSACMQSIVIIKVCGVIVYFWTINNGLYEKLSYFSFTRNLTKPSLFCVIIVM